MELEVRNVNDAFHSMMVYIRPFGIKEQTRNGEAYVMTEPVITRYERPTERVLWDIHRNANPIFHLMEALWMLAGRMDVKFLAMFNKRMAEYSDGGEYLYGAYGYRWHYFFGFNQLDRVVQELRKTPASRRAVLSMWSPKDLNFDSKDIPCNTHIYFRIYGDQLDMTVCCRSNDMIWGAYGTNFVHFSFLQEYVAAAVGKKQGELWQFSNNFHAYVDVLNKIFERRGDDKSWIDYYSQEPFFSVEPLVKDPFTFLDNVRYIARAIEGKVENPQSISNPFLLNALWMALAWFNRKGSWKKYLDRMTAKDWQLATELYIERNVSNNELS